IDLNRLGRGALTGVAWTLLDQASWRTTANAPRTTATTNHATPVKAPRPSLLRSITPARYVAHDGGRAPAGRGTVSGECAGAGSLGGRAVAPPRPSLVEDDGDRAEDHRHDDPRHARQGSPPEPVEVDHPGEVRRPRGRPGPRRQRDGERRVRGASDHGDSEVA